MIAGGPCMGNPEPIADFVDAFVVGDGEETLRSVCRMLEEKKAACASRGEKVRALAGIKGVYVPSLYPANKNGRFVVPDIGERAPVRAAKIPQLASEDYPQRPLVPIIDVVHHRLAAEVMRGCTRGCRFCAAGTYYRPVRERDPAELCREIESGITTTGWRDVGLLSLSSADYSCMSDLLGSALSLKRRYHVSFSLPSTRIDALSGEQFDEFTAVSPVTSMTLAPEAGSARLRRVINKDFTDETIYSAVKTLLDRNVQTIKLYFMIGLPTETQGDIEAILAMVSKISRMANGVSQRRSINVSISPFSPKPHTPFQWEAMEPIELLDEKSRFLKRNLRHLKNVKLSYRNVKMTLLETLMARGDRAIAPVIHGAWKLGARFDGWEEKFDLERWARAAEEASVNFSTYLDAIALEEALPWRAVDVGVSGQFLMRERERSRAEESTADCRSAADCSACGACDPGQKPGILKSGSRTGDRAKPAQEAPAIEVCASGGVVRLYRFIYRKGAALRFLGHLDMMAVFHRAFIGAGFKLLYSQGFQPHPKVAFGPPLPFAVLGEAEAFDMATIAPLGDDPLRANAMLPEDLSLLSWSALYEGGQSLTASIKAAEYLFVPCEAASAPVLQETIDSAARQQTLSVVIEKNGTTKTKDLRPLFSGLRVGEFEGSPCLQAVLSLKPGATCKPSELISVLFPERKFTEFLVVRKECLVERGGKLTALTAPPSGGGSRRI